MLPSHTRRYAQAAVRLLPQHKHARVTPLPVSLISPTVQPGFQPTSSPKRVRHASHTSYTAVNAQNDIPPKLKALHAALEGLKKDAVNYVNISRLGLALRSLESSRPTIRIAILGLNSTATARRLTRLLLADVLDEEGHWEKHIEKLAEGDRRGLLLRYGEQEDDALTPSNSLVHTLHVPSRLLKEHNLEILISALDLSSNPPNQSPHTAGADELRRLALVPTAETPKTFRGVVSYITYPVHRALVLAEGIGGCLSIGKYAPPEVAEATETRDALKLALNIPSSTFGPRSPPKDISGLAILDIENGAKAIEVFRESNTNGTKYQQHWNHSGISQISSWLAEGFPESHQQDANPAVMGLVEDVVVEASRGIMKEDQARLTELARPSPSEGTRQPLDQGLRGWAMRAHSELRDEMDRAFTSHRWSRLRWWKLFWRVDDVTLALTELLERHWLVDAEKSIIWLSGRSAEAGFEPSADAGVSLERVPILEAATQSQAQVAPASSASALPNTAGTRPATPWPSLIPASRITLRETTIPDLQATAQALLVQTITVTGATSGLAALIYLALPTATLYSTGAVAALGLTWSLRRLQKTWENLRAYWEANVREAGRTTLKSMEESFRSMLMAPRAMEDDVATQDRLRAKQAVDEAQKALRKLRSGT